MHAEQKTFCRRGQAGQEFIGMWYQNLLLFYNHIPYFNLQCFLKIIMNSFFLQSICWFCSFFWLIKTEKFVIKPFLTSLHFPQTVCDYLYRQTINGMHLNSIVNLIRLIKFYWKVLSKFVIKRNSLFICIYYYFAISHFISLSERHVFMSRHVFYLWRNLS
jgi:hypothetical protein